MKQDDVTATLGRARHHAAKDVADDLRHSRPLPVFAVDVQADRNIAAILRLQRWQDLVRRRRFGIPEEWCPEQLERPASKSLEEPLRGIELEQGLDFSSRRQIGVGVGVVADLVPLGNHALEQTTMGESVLADHEKRRGNMLCLKDVEDLGRPQTVRPVIEGEGKVARLVPGARNGERPRQIDEFDVTDQPPGVQR